MRAGVARIAAPQTNARGILAAMTGLSKKLQIPPDVTLTVLHAPDELSTLLDALATEIPLRRRRAKDEAALLVFVRSCAEIAGHAAEIAATLEGDALFWCAYPKKSSKRYASDVGRDDSWEPLGALGFEGVRQVAIDADWSALRFRRAEHIRTLKRDPKRAMSAEGKRRTKG
jgi:hypothetical protein